MDIEEVAREIVDSAYKVHRALRPGLLESAYGIALFHELTKRGLRVQPQVPVAVHYDGVNLGTAFRVDVLVEDLVVVELKAVEAIMGIHEAQVLRHMRLSGKKMGFLINFFVKRFKDGIKRFVI